MVVYFILDILIQNKNILSVKNELEKFTTTQLFASLVIIGGVYLVNKKVKTQENKAT